MSYSNPDRCRISLHADSVQVDLALPAGVPVAVLIPSIVDILTTRGGKQPATGRAVPYRLSCPDASPLDNSKTLAQQGIRDGAVLVLSRAAAEVPAPRFDDLAEQVSATVRAKTRAWTPRATRLTAALVAVWLAAVAGFVAVPGGPGAPNALLAAAAAAAVAVLGMQVAEAGPAMTAACSLAILVAVAALAAMLTRVSPQVIGAVTTAVSIGLLQAAARVSMRAAGLSQWPRKPRQPPPPPENTIRAHELLTGLIAALSAAAALGVVGAVAGVHGSGTPRFGGAVLAAVSGAALLLRARWHTDRSQVAALVTGGIATLTAALAAAAFTAPQHLPWLCASAAALAGGALYLGGVAAPVLSPVTQRGIELLEYPVLAAVVPVACWVCGCYGAVRGLGLT